jgi:hypothetical protein
MRGRTTLPLVAALLAALAFPAAALFAAEACGSVEARTPGPQDDALRAFAREQGLVEIEAFVGTADSIYRTGQLPVCYLDKATAEARGWHPGEALSRVVPGDAIGGDRFGNFERVLPADYDGRYREADLDEGRRRGGHRLVYVEGSAGRWLQWVTIDHYRSFHALPGPRGGDTPTGERTPQHTQ